MKIYRFISVKGDSVDRVLVWDNESTSHETICATLIPIGKGYDADWTLVPHDDTNTIFQVRESENINGYRPLIGFFTVTDMQMMGVPVQLVNRTYE